MIVGGRFWHNSGTRTEQVISMIYKKLLFADRKLFFKGPVEEIVTVHSIKIISISK